MKTTRLILSALLAQSLAAQQPTVPELVATLAAAETYAGEAEHEGGGRSPTWLAFARLREVASSDELKQMLAHDSPIVRNYAARGLADRRAKVDWPAILVARVGDDVMVQTQNGCLHDESRSGDILFALAQERELLTAEQWRDMAERLVRADSKLQVRERLLRTVTFADAMRPLLRERADRGDDAALVALARMRQPDDVPRLVSALRRERGFGDASTFAAAALFADERVALALFDLRDRALATAVDANVWDLEAWVTAIVAQRSEAAAAFLAAFRRDVLARADRDRDAFLREQCDTMLRKVLAGDAGGGSFAALGATVRVSR